MKCTRVFKDMIQIFVQKLRNLLRGGEEVVKILHWITGGRSRESKTDYIIFEWFLMSTVQYCTFLILSLLHKA